MLEEQCDVGQKHLGVFVGSRKLVSDVFDGARLGELSPLIGKRYVDAPHIAIRGLEYDKIAPIAQSVHKRPRRLRRALVRLRNLGQRSRSVPRGDGIEDEKLPPGKMPVLFSQGHIDTFLEREQLVHLRLTHRRLRNVCACDFPLRAGPANPAGFPARILYAHPQAKTRKRRRLASQAGGVRQ